MPVADVLALCSLALPTAVSTAPNAAPPLVPVDRREDMAIARAALEEGHPGLYRFTPRPELDRAWDAVGAKLTRPMDASQLYRILAPVIARIRCGHTRIELPDTLDKELNGTRLLLPLQVRDLEGRIGIARELSTNEARLEGDELTRVNGMPAAGLLSAIERPHLTTASSRRCPRRRREGSASPAGWRSADGRYQAIGHPNWGTPSPTPPHFAGKVYVLENGASFSTTCEFMSHVRDARCAGLGHDPRRAEGRGSRTGEDPRPGAGDVGRH